LLRAPGWPHQYWLDYDGATAFAVVSFFTGSEPFNELEGDVEARVIARLKTATE
jgi:hypothetical protein